MTTGTKKRTKAEARRAAAKRRTRRKRLAWGGAAAVVAVAAAVAIAAAERSASQPQPVERLLDIHGVAIPPWAPDEIYVATHTGLVRIDADGWWEISRDRHDFMGFSVNPAEEGVFLVSGHPAPGAAVPDPIGLMESRDGGVTWDSVSLLGEVDFHAMGVDSTGEIVYGWYEHGGLYRSVDGGRTWETPAAPDLQQAGGVLGLAVSPVDAEQVLAATPAGLLSTGDGGSTWESVLAEPVSAAAYTPGQTERVVAYAAAEGLMISEDAGATWSPSGWSAGQDAVASIAVHPDAPDTIVVGTYAADLLRSDDGGETFRHLARGGVPEDR